jgi:thiol-disulfide isomerase/thioredoxin
MNAADAPLLPDTVDDLPAFDFDQFERLGAQLNGVPVVVNIWSSWCGPCRDEASALAAAAEEHGDDVQFLGVDILDRRDDAVSFIRRYGWTYPSVSNASGDIRDKLGFVGQPETLFYDAAGRLVSTWIGPMTPDRLEQQIAGITAGGNTPPGTPTAAAS